MQKEPIALFTRRERPNGRSRHAPRPCGGLAMMIEAIDVRKTFQSGDEVVEALRG